MTRSHFSSGSQLFLIYFGKMLLGLYFLLLELTESEVVSTTSYGCRPTGLMTTSTCRTIDNRLTNGPTVIQTQQLGLVVQRGDNVYLPCRVHNLGGNQIFWRHESNIIAGSNLTTFQEKRHRLLPDFTLELTRVSSEDQGRYDCVVTGWPHLSITHTLEVLDPPTVKIEPDTGSIVVSQGDTIRLGCIPGGNPTPEIFWSKRDGTIPLHPSWFTRRRILIENVSAREAGVYLCRVDNRVGRTATGSIYVRVLHPPEVKTPNRRVHAGVKQNMVQLHCSVHADPKPDVQWLFGPNQKPVHLSRRIFQEDHGKDYYLNIISVYEKDLGSYFCLANNSFGYEMRHIELSGVPNPPVVTRWETSPCRSSNKDDENKQSCSVRVKLFWVVECYSPLIDYRLHFRSVSADQPVTSSNEDQAPPWTILTVPADPTPPSTFLHSKSYTIYGLPNNTMYEAAVRARNKFGWSFLSPVFYFTSVPNSTLKINEAGEAFRYSDEYWKNGPASQYPWGNKPPDPEFKEGESNLSPAKFSKSQIRCNTIFLLSIILVFRNIAM